ncbi:Rqc2 family fibronectin-binding protein [Salisaeta longa]|uniref:Rqc2 family fibronectin-binding protein n=1 Tax=Salisaeta longa TaxID=503170 RepID=UPI0003B43FC5|nr:NFACT RNA binding domain-containing protein [Salisaeta longa]
MHDSFFTFAALVREWTNDFVGATVHDAYSQVKNECTVVLAADDTHWTLRCSVQQPFIYLFRTEGYHKARRNVASVFADVVGRVVADVHMAPLDRMLFMDFADGSRLQWQLFGSRANIFWVVDDTVQAAFQRSEALRGTAPPTPRPAPMPTTRADFEARWRPNRNKTRQAVQSAVPLFGPLLARETLHRAGVSTADPADCSAEERARLFDAAQAIQADLQTPQPVIYGPDPFPAAFALCPLQHRTDPSARFDTVDAAVATYVKRTLAKQHFHRLYDPLHDALTDAAAHYQQSAEQMLEALTAPSRAARYEHWAHLLMAQPEEVPPGAEEGVLPDLFADGAPVTIPLDPARSPIENAERYYDKARRTRRSREEAEARLMETQARAEAAQELLEALRDVSSLDGIKAFREQHADALAPFVQQKDEAIDDFPFRRFDLGDGYEVWVGKNARQNDDLTFHWAQKYDLWMHARGVPGSHTILHVPNRDAQPGKHRLHTAARIAAYYSKARGSGVVPVMVTERKYVTSPKGSAPGAVRVQREDVLLVEPGLPS